MASHPITSWHIDGERMTDFIFLDSKITADGDCSHEIKRCMLLGRKAMTNLDSILKQRYYFADKSLSSQGYGFSSGHVWMWVGLYRKLNDEELMLLNCGVGEDSWESLGLQGNKNSQSWRSEWKSLSCVWLFVIPWPIQSMEFSGPEYWIG